MRSKEYSMSIIHLKHQKNIMMLLTNIYWIFNIIVIVMLTYYSYNFTGTIRSTQHYSDRLTWFAIITALWISGLTVIVFVLGKTNEIIYGIKFSNILLWQITFPGVIFSSLVYAFLLPWGFFACFCGLDACIVVDAFLTFTWLIGLSFFVIYFSKRTNAAVAIQYNTYERAKKLCNSCINFNTDYLGEVNQFPLIKMIRYMDHDDFEETQRLKAYLIDLCNLFDENRIMYQYFILMPIISEYCKKAGFKKRYESACTADFLNDLLRQHWNPQCRLWIQAGIILPIAEKWRGANTSIDIVNILGHIPWNERRKLMVVILLYIEYLYCCGDIDKTCIITLKRLDLLHVAHEFYMDETQKNILYKFWISWNLLDHQENFIFKAFYNFIDDWNKINNKEYVCQTWILKKLTWEEWLK